MQEQNTNTIQDTDVLDQLIVESLEILKKERDREILAKRHGIKNHESQTLEQIGSELGITRERVRQIEKAALGRIRAQHITENELNTKVNKTLDQFGGIILLDNLIQKLGYNAAEQPKVRYLVRIDPTFALIDSSDQLESVVMQADAYQPADIADLHNKLIEAIKAVGKPSHFDKIAPRIDGPHKPVALEQLAEGSKIITKLDQNWGLISWPEVNPKSIRDKVYLVLKKNHRPMHFTEIAEQLDSVKANPKRVTTQAVHNELIKDPRFILIGRGIYALAEWGYQAGTVADIIEEILREESPLSKEEIVRRVLARRQVKVTTIALNLQEKPQFERVGKATYRLAKTQDSNQA